MLLLLHNSIMWKLRTNYKKIGSTIGAKLSPFDNDWSRVKIVHYHNMSLRCDYSAETNLELPTTAGPNVKITYQSNNIHTGIIPGQELIIYYTITSYINGLNHHPIREYLVKYHCHMDGHQVLHWCEDKTLHYKIYYCC